MLASLTSRVILLGTVVAAALACLVALLLSSSIETRASFAWVAHSQHIISELDEALSELREAESGQRGFLLTHDARFSPHFDTRVADAGRRLATLERLTTDNPAQHARAATLHRLVAQRVAILRETLALARAGQFARAERIVAQGQGRALMAQVDALAGELLQTERDRLAGRAGRAAARLAWTKRIALVGGPAIAALIVLLVATVALGIRRPLGRILSAMDALGGGRTDVRVSPRTGSREFNRLARGYNLMADRLDQALHAQRASDEQLQAANADLLAQRSALQARGTVIELLGGMAHRLQAARSDAELAQVLDCFVPQVLPGIPGALYVHNNSRNLLVRLASWGGPPGNLGPGAFGPESFAPEECWGLRLGQGHRFLDDGREIACRHTGQRGGACHCEPLLAGGEVIGMLFLDGVVGAEEGFRLAALGENISSALVNHRLQRDLKEQTVRDALTGLYNRRYMEEALATELARAARGAGPLAFVMCDVDHFKRFNDDHGHDAGDAVLQMVAAEMRSQFRDGDVACRYGGEEFAIIAPGATPAALLPRIERLRTAIGELRVRHGGQALGAVSMSFGIAAWHADMGRDAAPLVATADAALYRAKREGRNRAILAERAAA